MTTLISDLLKDEPVWLQIVIIGAILFFSINTIVITFSRFLEALDYLKATLFKKLKALFKVFKFIVVLIIKIVFFPITIFKLFKENKFYDQFIIINNDDKEKVNYEGIN
mgnify:CR=1 FL=1